MSFNHDDVQRLLQLLDSSHFDEMHLEAEGLKLTLRRNGAAAPVAQEVRQFGQSNENFHPKQGNAFTQSAHQVSALGKTQAVDASLLEVRAPMLGSFYGAPKPGAAPFVAVGGRVDKDTAVGIIEVMKLMNSIAAGVEGVVVEVLVSDGELVEFDQVLMRVRPA